ncbi:MAG: phosphohydrolase, partial [Thermoprotei archaeon]
GRARIPYEMGKIDIHALSALSIKCVELSKGNNKPVKIIIKMDDLAGYFQVEKVLMPKIESSGLKNFIEVEVFSKNNKLHLDI